MLITAIRDRLTGWIVWIIVGLICMTFALWGIQSYFEGLNRVVVAEVNGEEISYEEYQNALQSRRANMARAFGGRVDQSMFNTPEFRTQTVDELVSRSLLSEDVQNSGYRIGDEALTAQIQSFPAFQGSNGQFNKELYVQTLRAQGMSAQGFEESQRQQSAINQIRASFSTSAFVTDQDVDQLVKLTQQEREVDYFTLLPEKFEEGIEVEDAAVTKEFEDNKESYRLPAKIKVEYLELSVPTLMEDITVSDEELELLYEESKDDYIQAERRKASHILIKLAEDADADTDREAREKIEKLLETARADDADFAELAKENSEDVGSANNGGDLDYVERGVMVPPFEEALFAMEEGKISDPVRSKFGYHIIKLDEIQEERGKTFEEAKDELNDQEKLRLAEEKFVDLGELLRTTVFEQDQSLEPASEEIDVELQTSDWITVNEGTGVFSDPSVREAAFTEEVVEQDLNSAVVDVGVDSLVAMRRVEYEDSRLPEIDEVKDKVTESVKSQALNDMLESAAKEAVTKLQSGTSWEDTVKELEVESAQLPIKKDESQSPLERPLAEIVFTMAGPSDDKPVFGEAAIPGSGHVVYALKAVNEIDVTSVDDAVRDQLKAQLSQRYGDEAFASYQQGMRERADVRIVDENLGDNVDQGYGGGGYSGGGGVFGG